MVIRFELPEDVERELSRQFGDLGDAAKEALLIEAFRLGKLSHHELSVLLGLDRYETDALLKKHQVTEGTLTFQDLEEQRDTLDRLLGPPNC